VCEFHRRNRAIFAGTAVRSTPRGGLRLGHDGAVGSAVLAVELLEQARVELVGVLAGEFLDDEFRRRAREVVLLRRPVDPEFAVLEAERLDAVDGDVDSKAPASRVPCDFAW